MEQIETIRFWKNKYVDIKKWLYWFIFWIYIKDISWDNFYIEYNNIEKLYTITFRHLTEKQKDKLINFLFKLIKQ